MPVKQAWLSTPKRQYAVAWMTHPRAMFRLYPLKIAVSDSGNLEFGVKYSADC